MLSYQDHNDLFVQGQNPEDNCKIPNLLRLPLYEEGNRDGAVVRALTSHQCAPDLHWRHIYVEYGGRFLNVPKSDLTCFQNHERQNGCEI